MSELSKIEDLEKKLRVRKQKALAKEYQKLGRLFYKKSNAKSFEQANKILHDLTINDQKSNRESVPISSDKYHN